MRVSLDIDRKTTNVPSYAKKFFRILRQADSSIQLLPFINLNNDNDILTNDKDLPMQMEEVAKCAVEVPAQLLIERDRGGIGLHNLVAGRAHTVSVHEAVRALRIRLSQRC